MGHIAGQATNKWMDVQMSRPRFENLDPERQRVLFEVASEEFAANGFDGASLNRILEKTGMSKSSLYYYFDDKADLFTTLIERSISVLMRRVGDFDPEALTAETFWDDFEDRYEKAVTLAHGNGWLIKFGAIFYSLRSNPNTGAPTGRLFQAVRYWVGVIIERGQKLGVIRQDIPNSLLIDSTMGLFESLDRWVVTHWDDLSDDERNALPATHISLFRDLLESRESSRLNKRSTSIISVSSAKRRRA